MAQMIEKFARRIVGMLQAQGVVSEADGAVYEYGFHVLFNNVLDVLSIFVIGLLCGMLPQAALYHLAFIPLRLTAGGFHAKTHLRCFIFSTAVWLVSMFLIMQVPLGRFVPAGMALVSLAAVFRLAPISNPHNPLSEEKSARMRRYALMMSMVLTIAVLVCSLFLREGLLWIPASLAFGQFSQALLIVMESTKKPTI